MRILFLIWYNFSLPRASSTSLSSFTFSFSPEPLNDGAQIRKFVFDCLKLKWKELFLTTNLCNCLFGVFFFILSKIVSRFGSSFDFVSFFFLSILLPSSGQISNFSERMTMKKYMLANGLHWTKEISEMKGPVNRKQNAIRQKVLLIWNNQWNKLTFFRRMNG